MHPMVDSSTGFEDIWNGTWISLGVVTNPDYSGLLSSDVAECNYLSGSGSSELFGAVRSNSCRSITENSTTWYRVAIKN